MAVPLGLGQFLGGLGTLSSETTEMLQGLRRARAEEAYRRSLLGMRSAEMARRAEQDRIATGRWIAEFQQREGLAREARTAAEGREERRRIGRLEEQEGRFLERAADRELTAAERRQERAEREAWWAAQEKRPTFRETPTGAEWVYAPRPGETPRPPVPVPGAKPKAEPSTLTAENLDFPAWRYLMTGQLPFLGFGKAGAREAIIKRADEIRKELGLSPTATLATGADYASTAAALKTVTSREALTETFLRKIEQNVQTIREYQKRYAGNEWARIVNLAQNNIARGVMGSGDLAALQLALVSTSREVAKVESGSLGIAEASVQAQQLMDRLHDVNLQPAELEKVLQASITLGQNARRALTEQRDELKRRISGLGTPERQGRAPRVLAPNERRRGDGTIWRQERDGTIHQVE